MDNTSGHSNISVVCESSLIMKLEETIKIEEEVTLHSDDIKEEIYVFIFCNGREPRNRVEYEVYLGKQLLVVGIFGIFRHKVKIVTKEYEMRQSCAVFSYIENQIITPILDLT